MFRLYLVLIAAAVLVLAAGTAPLFVPEESSISTMHTEILTEIGAGATTTAKTANTTPPDDSEPLAIDAVSPSKSSSKTVEKTTSTETPPDQNTKSDGVSRIKNPYSSLPLDAEHLNAVARAALVNILCESGSNTVRSTSGSGVIIDPRGVILTNAHVAQYFFLHDSPDIHVSCVIRAGAPAQPRWNAELLFVPSSWVREHATDIVDDHPMGTGEHDYALLRITQTLDGSPIGSVPYLPVDTREAIGFTGDQVLVAGYPAEFSRGAAARNSLYPTSVVAQIGQLLTFSERVVDALSLGGTVLAQSGSSGGATVNGWGYLIGLLVTTSEGETTGTRDLRAISLAHIDRSILQHTGKDLKTLLQNDPALVADSFAKNDTPTLLQMILDAIQNY